MSTLRQAEKFSLPAQRRLLREHADRQGWSVVRELEDAGISGETIAERPAFRAALEAATKGEYDILLVIDLDRLTRSRDLRAWAEITEVLRAGGVRIATPSQEIDLSDEDDAFIGALFALLSGREKQKILKRARRGQEEAVRRGRRLGGAPPFGYRYDRNERKLVVDEDEAPVVPVLVELYLAGRTQEGVARELDRRGLRTRSGKPWRPHVVRQILRNPIYTGFTVWNRTNQSGSRDQERPRSAWIWSEQPAHESLLDMQTWERVQLMMRRRGNAVNQPSYEESPYLLTSLIRCSCGERMAGHSTIRKHPDGTVKKIYRRYLCQGYTKGKPRHPAVNAGKIEGEVIDQIAGLTKSPAVLERARKDILLDRMRTNTSAAKDLDALRTELEDCRRKQGVLYRDRLDDRVTVEQWERFNADLLAREEELSRRIAAEEQALLSTGGGPAGVGAILEALRDFRGIFVGLDIPEQKHLLQDIVERVQLDAQNGTTSVELRYPWRQIFEGRVETLARSARHRRVP